MASPDQGSHRGTGQAPHTGSTQEITNEFTKARQCPWREKKQEIKCIDETQMQMRISRNFTNRYLPRWPQPVN